MSVLVVFEAEVQPDKVAAMKAFLSEILPDTRSYKGCHEINVYFNIENASDMVFVETWDSRSHYENIWPGAPKPASWRRLARCWPGRRRSGISKRWMYNSAQKYQIEGQRVR